jgi:pyridoxamine 5'-phosphate oxidase
MQPNDLSKIRNEYVQGELDLEHVLPDPFQQFGIWMDQAVLAQIEEPTAMTLATVSHEGISVMVLLKVLMKTLLFFTNYS